MADEEQQKSLLEKILSDGKLARKEEQEAYAKDLVGEFVKQVLDAGDTASSDVEAFLVARIAAEIGGHVDVVLSLLLGNLGIDEGSDVGVDLLAQLEGGAGVFGGYRHFALPAHRPRSRGRGSATAPFTAEAATVAGLPR